MNDKSLTDRLRRPLHERDGQSVIGLLTRSGLPPHQLQLAGIGVLIALADDRNAAEPTARQLLAALAERRWVGDDELAAELQGALGDEPPPALRTVPVPLSELAEAMNSNEYGGRINLQEGSVWDAVIFNEGDLSDFEGVDFEDPDLWLGIEPAGSRAGWRDMADFIDTVADDRRADRLARAIDGSRAFRRFKDALYEWPDEQSRWYAFSEDRQLGRAREFLAAEGFRTQRY